MQVRDTTENDGILMASALQTLAVAERLFDALKLAGLPVSGPGLDKRAEASKWLTGVATAMAEQLRASRTAEAAAKAAADSTFRVKSMGPIPGTATPARVSKQRSRKKQK